MNFPSRPDFLVAGWLPEGQAGPWCVKRYRQDGVEHTCLSRAGEWWMDDSPKEFADSYEFLKQASGNILITGLGIGAIPAWLSRQPGVNSIVIVENDPHVISLVWRHLRRISTRIVLIQADARTFLPQRRYQWGWHDIWLDSRPPELQAEIDAFLERYAPYCSRQMVWIPSTPVRAE